MAVWTDIKFKNFTDQENVEVNRRLRYAFSKIDPSALTGSINDIDGTLLLSKGGTGASLTAPTSDNIMFYNVSVGGVGWLSVGSGLAISGTTVYNTIFGAGSTAMFYKITASTANLADISSTNSATFNVLASSSATIGRLGSTGSITANTLTASSASIGQISSTGSATFNTIASSSANIKELYASSAVFGNSTSYSQFESDGTLAMYGDATVWEDVNFSADATAIGPAAPSIVSFSTSSILIPALDGNVTNEELNAAVEYPHKGKTGSDIVPHVHWVPTTTSAGDVEFLLDYWLIKNGNTVTNGTLSAIDTTTGNAWIEKRFNIGTISSTGIMLGTQCLFRLYRVPASSDDTYPDDAGILTWGFHHEVDTVGSRQILTK